jgi:glycosyltransferase involved in cell wall biosynthesis
MSGAEGNLFICPAYHRRLGHTRLSEEFPNEPFAELSLEELATHTAKYLRFFQRYRRAVFFTYDLSTAPRIALWSAFLSWIGQSATVLDASGRKRTGSLASLMTRDFPEIATEAFRVPFLLRQISRDLRDIRNKKTAHYPDRLSFAYLRTDHWFGIKAGGSVTHVAGVANGLHNLGIPVFLISSDRLELIASDIQVLVIQPRPSLRNFQGTAEMAYNEQLVEASSKILDARKPTIIYQRYSPYNYTGAHLATRLGLPFVLEYNGSEVWMAKHWGTGIGFSKWAEAIELADLRAADAVVVVSQALKDELIARSIPASKILVNPNGVDTTRFNPEVVHDQSQILRKKLGLEKKTVAGFIATFGLWHGAEVLAGAIGPVMKNNPGVHFLFIGDGPTARATRQIINDNNLTNSATFTGMIPEEDAAVYLGACDLFVCPQIPNPDGTPFFGSPTKLFEYMAMQKGIIASRLDQIADVLQDGNTALLVTPGSVDELVDAILKLAGDPEESARLGLNARQEVSAQYTWKAHTQRILDHLRAVLT